MKRVLRSLVGLVLLLLLEIGEGLKDLDVSSIVSTQG